MKKNKSEVVKHRQRLLIIIALVLGILAIWTGFLGFLRKPTAQSGSLETSFDVGLDRSVSPSNEGTVESKPLSDESTIESGSSSDENAVESDPSSDENAVESSPLSDESTAESGSSSDENLVESSPFCDDNPMESGPPSDENAREVSSSSDGVTEKTSLFKPERLEGNTASHRAKSGFQLFMRIAFCIVLAAEGVDILLLLVLRKNIREHGKKGAKAVYSYRPTQVAPIPITRKNAEQSLYPIPGVSLGKIHDMGNREYQQDSFGQIAVLNDTGILAVLADGMGGLSGGERVSQKIVMEALNFGVSIRAEQLPNALPDMVTSINQAVNQMLGPQGLYTSGSTVVSALIVENALWWISVGDSRIYLYRDQRLNQLSRDHDLLQDWMGEILEGKRTMAEAVNDPDGRKLTSFIGMGELRYIDYNHDSISLLPGDRVLLMSDGIYGTVSDNEMEDILQSSTNVQEAASRIAQRVADASLPYQDNYTLVILGYDPPGSSTKNKI